MSKSKKMDELRESPAIQKMRTRILRSGSEGTFETYLQRLKRFLEWAELGPDEFLAEVESGKIYPPEKLNDFFDSRKDAPKSLKVYASAVKRLLRVNLSRKAKREIDWDDLQLPKMRTVEIDKAPTREVLKRALAESRGLRDKLVPLVAASSGMRVGSIAGLTVGEVDLEEFPDVAVIRVKPDIAKGEIGYVTFLTKEAKLVLVDYLEQRRRGGEEIGDDSPLVATPRGGFYSDPGTLSTRWGTMLDKAGLGQRGRRHRIYHFHVLRKFFRTSLERAGVSKSFRERLLGHAGEYLDVSYFDPAFEELLANYRSAVGELTVYGFETNGKKAMEMALISMREIAKHHGIDPTKVRVAMEYVPSTAEEFEVLRKEIDRRKENEFTVMRGMRAEQRVIGEDELEEHLADGWQFISVLNNGSGRVVVAR